MELNSSGHQTALKTFQQVGSISTEELLPDQPIKKQSLVKKKAIQCWHNFSKFENLVVFSMILTNVIILGILLPLMSASLTRLSKIEGKICISFEKCNKLLFLRRMKKRGEM